MPVALDILLVAIILKSFTTLTGPRATRPGLSGAVMVTAILGYLLGFRRSCE